jgi:hypothetical protein
MIGGEQGADRFLMEHLSSGWSNRPPASWAGRESPSERSKSIRIRGEEVFPTHLVFATHETAERSARHANSPLYPYSHGHPRHEILLGHGYGGMSRYL